MTQQAANNYLSNRVLKINVGYMMKDGISLAKDFELDIPRVKASDDLILDFVKGPIRMSRTKEGILVQATLDVGVESECYRCLEPVNGVVTVEIEELFATSNQLSEEEAEFRVDEDSQLDLGPLIRAETLILTARGLRCEDEVSCTQRMNDLEAAAGIDHIDPRFEALKQLLEDQTGS